MQRGAGGETSEEVWTLVSNPRTAKENNFFQSLILAISESVPSKNAEATSPQSEHV
jgi:hypothetical protein